MWNALALSATIVPPLWTVACATTHPTNVAAGPPLDEGQRRNVPNDSCWTDVAITTHPLWRLIQGVDDSWQNAEFIARQWVQVGHQFEHDASNEEWMAWTTTVTPMEKAAIFGLPERAECVYRPVLLDGEALVNKANAETTRVGETTFLHRIRKPRVSSVRGVRVETILKVALPRKGKSPRITRLTLEHPLGEAEAAVDDTATADAAAFGPYARGCDPNSSDLGIGPGTTRTPLIGSVEILHREGNARPKVIGQVSVRLLGGESACVPLFAHPNVPAELELVFSPDHEVARRLHLDRYMGVIIRRSFWYMPKGGAVTADQVPRLVELFLKEHVDGRSVSSICRALAALGEAAEPVRAVLADAVVRSESDDIETGARLISMLGCASGAYDVLFAAAVRWMKRAIGAREDKNEWPAGTLDFVDHYFPDAKGPESSATVSALARRIANLQPAARIEQGGLDQDIWKAVQEHSKLMDSQPQPCRPGMIETGPGVLIACQADRKWRFVGLDWPDCPAPKLVAIAGATDPPHIWARYVRTNDSVVVLTGWECSDKPKRFLYQGGRHFLSGSTTTGQVPPGVGSWWLNSPIAGEPKVVGDQLRFGSIAGRLSELFRPQECGCH